ncbi:hypothetical protein P3T39_007025 [Kitasatospora sp. GP82]|nr:hypothetical protein [Kitasatospora sp. GP82]
MEVGKLADMDDEALMRGRVYGADHDADFGPQPGHVYRELCAGPLDGLHVLTELLDPLVPLAGATIGARHGRSERAPP